MQRVRWWFSWLALGGLLGACEPSRAWTPPQEEGESERSPNAQIFPEPLVESRTRTGELRESKEGGSGGQPGAPAFLQAPSLYVDRALSEGAELSGTGAGFEFVFEFLLPEVRRAGQPLGSPLERAHASWRVSLLPDTAERSALQRIVWEGALFLLPEQTELRSSLEKQGWVLVWPDERSYRVVPRGALSTVLEERRVDRMPLFEGRRSTVSQSAADSSHQVVRRWETSVGSVEMSLQPLPEAGSSTLLFCETLLELLRMNRARAHCEAGELPVEVRYQWATGGELRGVVREPVRRVEGELRLFQIPPPMPIFKPGELPPVEADPWMDAELNELWPARGPALLEWKNTKDFPLLVLVEGWPLTYLDAGRSKVFPAPRGGLRYVARDFLGQFSLPGSVVTAPVQIHLGAVPEVQAVAPAPVQSPAQ